MFSSDNTTCVVTHEFSEFIITELTFLDNLLEYDFG